MKIINIIIAICFIMSPVCYAWETYQDTHNNTVDVEQTAENVQSVYYNHQFAGTIEHVPTSEETMDRIKDNIEESEEKRQSLNHSWNESE